MNENLPVVNFCFFKGQFSDTDFGKAYINAGTRFNGVKTDEMGADVSVTALTVNQGKESVDFTVGINSHRCIVAGAVKYTEGFSSVTICSNRRHRAEHARVFRNKRRYRFQRLYIGACD